MYEFGNTNKSQGHDGHLPATPGGDMTTINNPNFDPAELIRLQDHWEEVIDDIDTEIASLQRDRDAALQKITICAEVLAVFEEVNRAAKPSFGIHSHIDPRDLTGSETHIMAAKEIARRSDGRIKLADASRLIFAAGLSGATDFTSVRSSLFSQMSISDEWESEGRGTGFYRLLENTDTTDPQEYGTQYELEKKTLLSTETRKMELQSALQKRARKNSDRVTAKLIRDALREMLTNWDTSILELSSNEIMVETERWMMSTGWWQLSESGADYQLLSYVV